MSDLVHNYIYYYVWLAQLWRLAGGIFCWLLVFYFNYYQVFIIFAHFILLKFILLLLLLRIIITKFYYLYYYSTVMVDGQWSLEHVSSPVRIILYKRTARVHQRSRCHHLFHPTARGLIHCTTFFTVPFMLFILQRWSHMLVIFKQWKILLQNHPQKFIHV